jgi:hypothetical protein
LQQQAYQSMHLLQQRVRVRSNKPSRVQMPTPQQQRQEQQRQEQQQQQQQGLCLVLRRLEAQQRGAGFSQVLFLQHLLRSVCHIPTRPKPLQLPQQ